MHDQTVLVLQGGGALGAYQAGVYEGMAEQGIAPDWVAGVSIGAINGALIAGNPVELRLQRLREFWDRVSSGIPPIALAQRYVMIMYSRLTNRYGPHAKAGLVKGIANARIFTSFSVTRVVLIG